MPEESCVFPARLRAWREARGLPQRALSRALGVGSSTISMLESGERHPSRRMVLDLAGALGLSPAETDELLVAALHLPESYARDPEALLAARCLTDPAVAEAPRRQFREVVRLTALLCGLPSPDSRP